jgi:hypothetical protein
MRRLGKARRGKADGESGQVQDNPAQESSLQQFVLHFNSDGGKLKEDCEQEGCREFQPVPQLCTRDSAAAVELFFPVVVEQEDTSVI